MGTGDEEKSPPEPPPVIFIHRIDTYFGKVLAQQLGTNQPNATTSDVPDSGANFKGLTFLDAPGAPDCFQIIGSYRLPKIPDDSLIPKLDRSPPPPKVPAARELFSVDSEEELLKALDRAKIHIYHTADEDGENELFSDVEKALTAAKAHLLANKNKKTVFLVSPLMTWCKTRVKVPKLKPKDGEKEEEEEQVEDEPQPLTEEEAKRRKPHTKFKAHLDMEKDLLKFAKNSHRRISATVVGAGLTYGYGERILRWYFKDAWHNAPVLTVLGDGKNQVPMIHVRDLAQVLQNMCDSKPKTRYIIAIDAGIHTYQELVTGIAKQLTGGTVINIPPETLVVEKKVSQIDSELLTADLLFEARTILETMKIQWTAEEGFLKALPKVIREYKTLQNLTPIKVAIIGPPFSGKTTMAMKLADYYKLHYVSAENIVKDTEVKLAVKLRPVVASPAITVVKVPTTEISETEDDEKPAKSVKIPANESEDANDDGDQIGIQAAKKLLAEMQDSRNENNGHLGEAMIVRLLREKLLSKACLNQGYVLDGAPASYNMAKELFAPVELEEEEEKEEESRENEEDIDNEMPPTDKKLVPGNVNN
ncbi:Adenylate kinase 7 [Hypsibius exemplaris]|uniref:Adenylate kinase 7 n=1 Tax=Hypsibius exemplaris TaxID=2072580 RepID=A0A1W0WR39_HYPEX|nr:Adenylate kinase 7 [Hypsibius exemplaris]